MCRSDRRLQIAVKAATVGSPKENLCSCNRGAPAFGVSYRILGKRPGAASWSTLARAFRRGCFTACAGVGGGGQIASPSGMLGAYAPPSFTYALGSTGGRVRLQYDSGRNPSPLIILISVQHGIVTVITSFI